MLGAYSIPESAGKSTLDIRLTPGSRSTLRISVSIIRTVNSSGVELQPVTWNPSPKHQHPAYQIQIMDFNSREAVQLELHSDEYVAYRPVAMR